MKIYELLYEKIDITPVRAKLNNTLRKELENISGTLPIFYKNGNRQKNSDPIVTVIRALEHKLEKDLKEFGVTMVSLHGVDESYFDNPNVTKGSMSAGYMQIFLPLQLLDKNKYFGDVKRNEFIDYVTAVMLHELTHSIQHQRHPETKQTRKNITPMEFDDNGNIKMKPYLSKDVEIEAYAVNTTEMLMKKFNNDKNKLLHSIIELTKNKSDLDVTAAAILRYWDHFGSSSDRNDQRVWQRFLKKLHQHIVDF